MQNVGFLMTRLVYIYIYISYTTNDQTVDVPSLSIYSCHHVNELLCIFIMFMCYVCYVNLFVGVVLCQLVCSYLSVRD